MKESFEFSREIISSTKEVFSTMVMLDIDDLTTTEIDVDGNTTRLTSMLGLGGGLRGILAFHCPKAVATGITSAFLGMDVLEIDEDVKDAVGEITNMVAGGLKVYLASKNINIELAIPTSVIGKSFKTSGLSGASQVIVPFSCDSGKFWVELKFVLTA